MAADISTADLPDLSTYLSLESALATSYLSILSLMRECSNNIDPNAYLLTLIYLGGNDYLIGDYGYFLGDLDLDEDDDELDDDDLCFLWCLDLCFIFNKLRSDELFPI